MKKLAAILLLLLFLFNLVGYRLWFSYAQQQADIQLESSLDNNQYNDADLITIKVPLSMPYQTVQSSFERVNGEINFNGKTYKYVKRRIVDGEMVLLCLPDQHKMRIESAKTDFFKNTADIQNNSSKKSDNTKTSVFKNLVSEYDQHTATCNIAQISTYNNCISLQQEDKLHTSPHTPPVQPPDLN